jgi:hypothetical protein
MLPSLTVVVVWRKDILVIKRVPLVLTYHPFLEKMSGIFRHHWKEIQKCVTLTKLFPEPPVIAFRRPKSIKDTLVRAAVSRRFSLYSRRSFLSISPAFENPLSITLSLYLRLFKWWRKSHSLCLVVSTMEHIGSLIYCFMCVLWPVIERWDLNKILNWIDWITKCVEVCSYNLHIIVLF